jgi:uncharacterized MAPEG superfamily protein
MFELYCLVVVALLLVAAHLISTALHGRQIGDPGLVAHPDDVASPVGAARRAGRAHRNLLENAVPFGFVVLAAHALAISTPITKIAAVAFVAARLSHVCSYVAGIRVICAAAWFAGMIATAVIGGAVLFG